MTKMCCSLVFCAFLVATSMGQTCDCDCDVLIDDLCNIEIKKPPVECPPNYQNVGDECFYIVMNDTHLFTYQQAEQACTDEGGEIVYEKYVHNEALITWIRNKTNKPSSNMALHKPASFKPGYIKHEYAVDGIKDDAAICFSSEHRSSPWWRVDLGKSTKVTDLTIYHMSMGCFDVYSKNIKISGFDSCRLSNNGYQIYVSDSILNWNSTENLCFTNNEVHRTIEDVQCTTPLTGRYVTIFLPWDSPKSVLRLCEVEVNKNPDITLNKPTSSSPDNLKPEYAVDGDNDTESLTKCANTELRVSPWWRVDLGQTVNIENIVLYRYTVLWSRTVRYQMYISDSVSNWNKSENLCYTHRERKGTIETVQCDRQFMGRYVTIYFPTFDSINKFWLCEIKVYGTIPAKRLWIKSVSQNVCQMATFLGTSNIDIENANCDDTAQIVCRADPLLAT